MNQKAELQQGQSHCFMAEQDELLGTRYLSTMQQHLRTTLIPGGHRLSDEAVQIIAEWLTNKISGTGSVDS